MPAVWIESLAHRYQSRLDAVHSALLDCPDELWESSMWRVPPLPPGTSLRDNSGEINDGPEVQERMLQAGSSVWGIAYHALWFVDYDLNGAFEPWEPPPPFGKDDQAAYVVTRVWRRDELLDYVEWCKKRAQQTLEDLTEERAATPLPDGHRYRGRPYAWLLLGIPLHLTEHTSRRRYGSSSPR